jgi:hypothetical protein
MSPNRTPQRITEFKGAVLKRGLEHEAWELGKVFAQN